MKRQKETPGSIFKIQFDEAYHTYGRILTGLDFAFYDCKTKEDITNLNITIASPILFTTFVDSYAIKKN